MNIIGLKNYIFEKLVTEAKGNSLAKVLYTKFKSITDFNTLLPEYQNTFKSYSRDNKTKEFCRCNLGSTEEEVRQSVTKILDTLGVLDKSEFIDFSFHAENSKHFMSYLVHINDYEGMSDDVYFSTVSSVSGYLPKGSEVLLPTSLNLCDETGYDTINELISDVEKNIQSVLPEGKNNIKQIVIDYCIDLMRQVYDKTTDSISIEDFNEEKFKDKFTIHLDNKEEYKQIDGTTSNTIFTKFGEVLCGVLVSKYTNSRLTFPSGVHNEVFDFFVGEDENLCGVSVKNQSGNRPEFGTVTAFRTLEQCNKQGGFDEMFKILREDNPELKNKTKIFVNEILPLFLDDSRKKNDNRINIIWKLAFKLLQENKGFQELLQIADIKNLNDCLVRGKSDRTAEINILTNFENYAKKHHTTEDKLIANLCNNLKNASKGNDKRSLWNKNTDDQIKQRQNYSKILRFLQYLLTDELNDKWVDVASLLFRFALGGKQIYISMNKKSNDLNFELISLQKSDYRFDTTGPTWNDALSHGSIMMNAVH